MGLLSFSRRPAVVEDGRGVTSRPHGGEFKCVLLFADFPERFGRRGRDRGSVVSAACRKCSLLSPLASFSCWRSLRYSLPGASILADSFTSFRTGRDSERST